MYVLCVCVCLYVFVCVIVKDYRNAYSSFTIELQQVIPLYLFDWRVNRYSPPKIAIGATLRDTVSKEMRRCSTTCLGGVSGA